jgi:chromosome segregation ATPase
LNNSNELSGLGELTRTIDLNGSNTSRNMFFTPRKDNTESVLQLQRKINELKEMLSDKDAQCDFLKRTLKFTEINELKQENEILYSECKRLRRFISILTNKTSDGENETEREILAELEEDFTNPGLKQKFKNKKTKIEALLEENDKVSKELQNIRKENQELKNQINNGDSRKKSGVGK